MNASFAANSSDGKARVLQAVNLVEMIGKTVSLKRRGKNYIGLCPFHSEKTPSFNVDPGKQFFKCFGCKEAGNAIDFVMKRDRLTFVDALRQLAEEYGVELPRYGAAQKQNSSERQLMLEAHSAACGLFEKLLSHPSHGSAARDYIAHRGFDQASVQKFQIGLALDSWDTLLTSAAMRKFDPQLLQAAGLVKKRENGSGYYDTFRNRLMFPIRDENARIIAFGGRVMPGSEDPAKYLNSPETPLFSKSKSVFGLDLARQKIVESRTVAIVEGYTDVVMAHQYGATNVVSILGTAMTEQHVTLLRRFADKIVLLFDADTAGETAVARAVELFLTQPIEILIASLPEDLDPDEYLMQHGVEAFNSLLSGAQDALGFKWKQLTREVSENDLTARQRAVRQYLDLLAGARGSGPIDPMRWGQALSRVSRLTEMPVDELNRLFRARKPVRSATPRAADDNVAEVEMVVPSGPIDGDMRARRWIMAALLIEPNRWRDVQQHVAPDDFATPGDALHTIAEQYWSHQQHEGEPVFNEFLSQLDASSKALAIELVEEVEALSDVQHTLDEALSHLNDVRRRREVNKTVAALRRDDTKEETEQDEIALLTKLQEQVRRPDLRRS